MTLIEKSIVLLSVYVTVTNAEQLNFINGS